MAALRSARSANATALETARRFSQEITALSAKSEAPPPSDPRATLERVLAQQKLDGAATQIENQEGRLRVVFAAIPFTALIAALESLQRDAQLRLVEASLTARVEPGMVRAELALAR
jgi:type II secretory pathway component PulM